jgi:uncharacterized protein (DUF1330 family)
MGENMTERRLPHANAALLAALPDEGPVVMLNLVRLRERSADGNGSGWDAYQRYSREAVKLIKTRGGQIIWAGDVQAVAMGTPGANRWDYSVLVKYPSRAAFIEMMSSPEYAAANVHRENALEDHLILAVQETFAKLVS